MHKDEEIPDLTRGADILEELLKTEQKITIRLEMRKFNKPTTLIEGIDSKNFRLSDLAKGLKVFCACGGTAKDGRILLQGDQRNKTRQYLVKNGFVQESIMII